MKKIILSILILLFISIPALAADYYGPKKIPPASTSTTGTVTLSTDAQAVTGTATDVVTTPANITARMAAPGAIGGTTPAGILSRLTTVTVSSSRNITALEMAGQTLLVTGAYTASLPTAVAGYWAVIESTTAAVYSVDVATGTDVIRLNGTALSAGNKATSDGTLGARMIIKCVTDGTYIIDSVNHVALDGGA